MVYIRRFTHSRRKAEKTGKVEMACIHPRFPYVRVNSSPKPLDTLSATFRFYCQAAALRSSPI